MALEKIAKLEILTQYVEALVAAEALKLGGMRTAIHPGCQRTPLEAMAAELAPPKAGSDSTGLHNKRHGLSRERLGTKAGEGRGCLAAACFGSQMRRKTCPSVMPEVASQRSSARTGHSSVSP